MKFFEAEIETRSSHCHGYGVTAEEAVQAILKKWRDDWSPSTGADPTHLAELREELAVFEIETGKGYVIGCHDGFSRQIAMQGNDYRLDHLFEEYLNTPATPQL